MPEYSIPRHIWRAVYPILIFFGISIFVIVTAVIAFGLSFAFESALLGDMPAQSIIEYQVRIFLERYGMWTQLAAGVAGALVFALMWRKARTGIKKYDNNKLNPKLVLLTILLGAALNIALASLFVITDIMSHFPSYEGVAEALLSGSFFARLLALGIAAPFVEELCCRGIVFNRLNSWTPVWVAVLISSALFGAMHLNLFQGSYAFLLGVVFCVLYARYRNLWIPIIGHIAFNVTNIALVEVISIAGAEEISAIPMLVPSALVAVGCVVVMVKMTSPAVLVPVPDTGGETIDLETEN